MIFLGIIHILISQSKSDLLVAINENSVDPKSHSQGTIPKKIMGMHRVVVEIFSLQQKLVHGQT